MKKYSTYLVPIFLIITGCIPICSPNFENEVSRKNYAALKVAIGDEPIKAARDAFQAYLKPLPQKLDQPTLDKATEEGKQAALAKAKQNGVTVEEADQQRLGDYLQNSVSQSTGSCQVNISFINPSIPSAQEGVSKENVERQGDILYLLQAMWTSLNAGDFDPAEARANEVLRLDPSNSRALNGKGAIAFYRGQYQQASEFFGQAHNLAPTDRSINLNLGDAFVELGAYNRALNHYKAVTDNKQDWMYKMGRLLTYRGNFTEAVSYLEALPNEYRSSTIHLGSSRFVEAAAYAGLSRKAGLQTKEGKQYTDLAKEKLSLALQQDKEYWTQVLQGSKHDMHQGHNVPRQLLEIISHDNLGR